MKRDSSRQGQLGPHPAAEPARLETTAGPASPLLGSFLSLFYDPSDPLLTCGLLDTWGIPLFQFLI